MRPPFPFEQKDPQSCEVVFAAQLLYMYELLEPEGFENFNAKVGRKPGEVDKKLGYLKVLLKAGFELWEFSSFDRKKLVSSDGRAYLAGRWARKGYTDKQIKKHLPKEFATIRERVQNYLKITQKFSSRYKLTPRDATPKDLAKLVDDGWFVGCEYDNANGTSHMVMVVGREGSKYVIFEGYGGITRVAVGQFSKAIAPTLEAYRMPTR